MKGAREYCEFFPAAEQVDRLYIVPSSHARGKTFRVWVLPDGEKAIENAGVNPPLNKDAVMVYGITGGQPGWTETYGWLHNGPWKKDLAAIVAERKATVMLRRDMIKKAMIDSKKCREDRDAELLASYAI